MSYANVSDVLKHTDRFFIGGAWVEPSTDAWIQVVAPATEDVFLTVPEAKGADIDRAVAAARTAFDKGPWPRMSPGERAVYLRAIADRINERVDEIAYIWP